MTSVRPWAERFRNELGLALTILAVALLTAALDSGHSYWNQPWDSLVDLTRQTSLLGIFSLGSAIVIISGGIDLSAGSVIAFSGTICGTIMILLAPEAMKNSAPVGWQVGAAAIAGTLVVGFLIGSIHAWLITVIELPPFVATLATLVGLRSLGRLIVERITQSAFGYKRAHIEIGDSSFLYLATSIWIPAVVFGGLAWLAWLLMSRTVTGRHLYALGGNEEAARLSGISTQRLKWFAYCAGSVTASIAGILYVCDQSSVDPQTLGRGYELNAIAAAVVGGCSLQGGIGTMPGTVLGVVFLRLVIDAVNKIIKTGADVYEGMIVGLLVIVAVAVSQLRAQSTAQKRFFAGPLGLVVAVSLVLLAASMAALFAGANSGAAAAAIAAAAIVGWKLFEARRASPHET